MIYPPEFVNLDAEAKAKFLAAPCGPGTGIVSWIIPEDLLGLDVREPCGIHDFMYARGKTKPDKIKADETFLHNLLCLVIEGEERTASRAILALVYFMAVRCFGGRAFKGARR